MQIEGIEDNLELAHPAAFKTDRAFQLSGMHRTLKKPCGLSFRTRFAISIGQERLVAPDMTIFPP